MGIPEESKPHDPTVWFPAADAITRSREAALYDGMLFSAACPAKSKLKSMHLLLDLSRNARGSDLA